MTAIEVPKISKDDLQDKFVELQGNIDNAATSAKDIGKKVGIIALVLILIIAFILGRKRGAAAKTVVEIRRL